ncbi:Heavy metal response transcriptional activator protein [Herminiimonas arsenicoxydans]|uniref:Heavy metal response transcriptional activator protein n=1 Tax=Herminiimonas arsenicoxydans TaxID=204773 RepID=A4G2R7_HERAR|nr:Heavy metal response transcriptional activator protein [Herminiimonas arsenicoxydans]
MRILVIEDEPKIGDYLVRGLAESGFTVCLARNGRDGLFMATHEAVDLIVLDMMLPLLSGWELLTALRSQADKQHIPVICLTARGEVEDRVKGLELGADDYLIKPFAFVELLARIRTLLRRSPVRDEDFIRIGDMEIDVMKRKVMRNGKRITLTAKEFGLLHLLARRQSEVLSRSVIASQVWDINFESDTNVIDAAVRRLRSKIDDPFETKLIHTQRGMGYVCEVRDPEPQV